MGEADDPDRRLALGQNETGKGKDGYGVQYGVVRELAIDINNQGGEPDIRQMKPQEGEGGKNGKHGGSEQRHSDDDQYEGSDHGFSISPG